jgi:hypothetical protein
MIPAAVALEALVLVTATSEKGYRPIRTGAAA